MKLNIVLPSPVSARPYAEDLYCLPVAAVPYVLGALRLRMSPYWYTTPEDYARGRSLLAEFSGGLLMGCVQEITNAVDRLTALFDASINGQARELTGTGTEVDPYVYTPALPTVFDGNAYDAPSLREDTRSTYLLLDNLTTGVPNALSADARSFRDQLEEIRATLAAMGADSDEVEEILNLILLALA